MIEYFYPEKIELKYFFRSDIPIIGLGIRDEIDKNWTDLLNHNTSLFNGLIYSCHSFDSHKNRINIGVNRTDYKTYKWARDRKKILPGVYAMGVGMFVLDEKTQNYAFLKRSKGVAFDAEKISIIGGVLDYDDVEMSDFPNYVKKIAIHEVEEEVDLKDKLRDVRLLGMYFDTKTYKVEFVYFALGSVLKVTAEENVEVINVPKKDLVEYLKINEDHLEESTRVHLGHLVTVLSSIGR